MSEHGYTPTPDLAEYMPRTEQEAYVTARAVIAHREDVAARDQVRGLTEFEVRIMERAWAMGQEAAIARVERVLGRAAATADVAVLRAALADRDGLRVRFLTGPHRDRYESDDQRAADLVRTVRRELEAEDARERAGA